MAEDGSTTGASEQRSLKLVKDVIHQLETSREGLVARRLVRETNLKPVRPGEEEMKRLDSSVKRNTALIKKLRQVTEDNYKGILEDIRKVNQSKYVSEAVAAIAEAPLRASDIPAAVQVCSALHQRYEEFSKDLPAAITRVFKSGSSKTSGGGATAGEEDRALVKKRRSALRLMTDLLVVGVYQDPGVVLSVVRDLCALDYQKDREGALTTLQLVASFAKGARDTLLGLPMDVLELGPGVLAGGENQKDVEEEELKQLKAAEKALKEELDQHYQLSPGDRQLLLQYLDRAYTVSCTALVDAHQELQELEKENARIMNTRGDITEEASTNYERKRKAYESLYRGLSTLAEALGRDMPELVEDAFTRLGTHDSKSGHLQMNSDEAAPVFEDPETRAFYEALPDLRSLVPAVLLKDAVGVPGSHRTTSEEGATAEVPEGPPEDTPTTKATIDEPTPKNEGDSSTGPDQAPHTSSTSTALDQLLSRLTTCVSSELCDQWALDFCYTANTKAARKKLVRALTEVPRASLQLVPYYARIVAALSQVYPEIGSGVVAHLEEEFNNLLLKKDPTNITLEPRIKNCRYLAEMAKFKLTPYGLLFMCLKQLLDDFQHHNIDAACALVDTAGRYLIRLPETKTRMENMLDVMMRLRNVKNLDARHAAAVDNAYFQCKPPEKSSLHRKRRAPVLEYIRHLIFDRLSEATIVEVLKKLMKLPWATCHKYILKCLLKVVRGRFTHLPLIASLAGGLSQYHDVLGVMMVDCVLEDIRAGLEDPASGTYQKRLADVKLMGELYNYMLVDSRTVFDTLYMILGLGHEDPALSDRIDPPDDYFRIRLVCALLDTCGCYFVEGVARKRLDRFLTFFMAYCLSKDSLPLDVEFDLQDLLGTLKMKMKKFESYEEAVKATEEILRNEAAARATGLGTIEEEEEEEEERERQRGGGGHRGAAGLLAGDTSAEEVEEEESQAKGLPQLMVTPLAARRAEFDCQFDQEFIAMMAEYQGRPAGPAGAPFPPAGPATVPPTSTSGGGQADPSSGSGEPEAVSFKLLMKKGGKDDKSKELQVPLTSTMALTLKQREESEAQERHAIKRLVLEANKREEQSELFRGGVQHGHGGPGGGRGGEGGHHRQRGSTSSYYHRGGRHRR